MARYSRPGRGNGGFRHDGHFKEEYGYEPEDVMASVGKRQEKTGKRRP